MSSAREAFIQLHNMTLPDEIVESDFTISYDDSGVEIQDSPVLPAGSCKKSRLRDEKCNRECKPEKHYGRGNVPLNAWDRVTPG